MTAKANMKNTWKIFAAACAAALTLGACSGGSSDSDSDSSDSSAETRTVTSSFTGEDVEIPVEPKRVLGLWRVGSELADLGIMPVGTLEGEFLESELGSEVFSKYADVPSVGSFEGVDIEKVIEADPDLIVGMDNGGLSIDYDELSEVAPVVILKIAEPTDVWNNYPELADIVGKSTTYDDQQAALEEKLGDIKAQYGDVLATKNVTSIGVSDGLYVETSKSLSYVRITEAGFGYNATYTENPERYVTPLAQENIADLANQDIIFYRVGIDGSADDATQAILDSESFKALPAAQAGNVFPLTSGLIYTFEGANKQADDIAAAAEKIAAE